MIRKKHSLCYKVFVESSTEDINALYELDDKGLPCFITSTSCVIYNSKKDVFNYLNGVVGKYPFINVMKSTHKYTDVIFIIDNEELRYNKLGYKREDK